MKWIAFLSIVLAYGCGTSALPQRGKSTSNAEIEVTNTKSNEGTEITCGPFVEVIDPHPPTSVYPKPPFILTLNDGKLNHYFVYDKKLVDSFISSSEKLGYAIHTFKLTPAQKQTRHPLFTFDVQVSHDGKILYDGQLYKLDFGRKK